MRYKYDLHVHCKEGSPCANDSAKDLIRAYKKASYTGIVLTDHYMKENIMNKGKDKFKEQIKNQIDTYKKAKAEGDLIGLDVLFGFEFRYGPYDFLVYNIFEDFLSANEDIFDIDFKEFASRVHNAGGFICQAHPFRYDGHNPICVFTPYVDALEIYNGSHVTYASPFPPVYNDMAKLYAEGMGIIGIAGSDTHDVDKRDGTPLRKASMLFEEKLKDIPHMIELIKSNKFSICKD